jgi:hypothetical protein
MSVRLNFLNLLVAIVLVMAFMGSYLASLGAFSALMPNLIVITCTLLITFKWKLTNNRGEMSFVVPGGNWVLMLFAVILISGISSGEGLLQIALFTYATFVFYLVLFMLANTRLNENDFLFISLVVIVLSLMQTPVAIYRLLDLGWSIQNQAQSGSSGFGSESASGTFGQAMGSIGTIFPLAAIGVSLSLMLNNVIRKTTFVFLLLWFVLFSFLVGKRAFPFVLPIYLVISYYFISWEKNRLGTVARALFFAVPLAAVLVFLGAKLHPSMNPERQVWGSFDAEYIQQYVIDYESSESDVGATTGRFSSTLRAVEASFEDGLSTVLIGRGPGTLLKTGIADRKFEETLQKIGIGYGVSGAVWIYIQLGLIGFVAMSGLLIELTTRAYRAYRSSKTRFDRALFGSVLVLGIVIIVDFFFYSTGINSVLPVLFAVGLARTYIRSR